MTKINWMDNPNLFRFSYFRRVLESLQYCTGTIAITDKIRTNILNSLANKEAKISTILSEGLDIGGIKAHFIRANLVYFGDSYGWHFVDIKRGEMFSAWNYLR